MKQKISIKAVFNDPTSNSFNLNDQIKFQFSSNSKEQQILILTQYLQISCLAATEKLYSGTTFTSDLAATASAVAAKLSDKD